MNITKRWNIVATTGMFEKDGETRKRYVRVGTLAETPSGPVIFLHAHFSPAGVPRPEDQQSILLSCYPADDNDAF